MPSRLAASSVERLPSPSHLDSLALGFEVECLPGNALPGDVFPRDVLPADGGPVERLPLEVCPRGGVPRDVGPGDRGPQQAVRVDAPLNARSRHTSGCPYRNLYIRLA